MEVPKKKAKTRPDGGMTDDGTATSPEARKIAELEAELERCKREKLATEQRHDQVVSEMKSALEWAYTKKNMPWIHWFEKGHDEEYVGAMGLLVDKFQLIIKELRTGAVIERIVVMFELHDDDDHRVTAAHDDLLMPYWEELANALIYWSDYHANGETLDVSIMFVETPDAVLDVLRPAIKRSSVEYVSFVSDGTPKSWKLAEFIVDIVQTNHKVTQLAFRSVILSNEEWTSICNAIGMRNARQSSVVSDLTLAECFTGGISTDMIKGILTSNLEELRLDMNGMPSREASIIAEFLNSDPSLARLHLCDNRFDDNDAAALANSFSNNTNLRKIDVEGNNIKEEGRLSFLRAIFDVTSLASCAASNHTCRVVGLEPEMSDLNCYDEASEKWEKIFVMLALSSQESFINTALLSGVPVSLMPVLLDKADGQFEEGCSQITDLYLELTGTKRCQRHDDWDSLGNTKPLNCVYEMMRSWVVPMIYV